MVATAKIVVIININPNWRLDRAVLGLVQRRIRVIEGTCHAEAPTLLYWALAGMREDISATLEDVVGRLPRKGPSD